MHELTTCPVCGSIDLKKIGVEEKEGQIFANYQCLSCDAFCSSYDRFKKQTEKPIKKVAEKKSNDELETGTENDATTIYKKNIEGTFEVFSNFGDVISKGTGALLSKKGYFITNMHVVTKGEVIKTVSDDIYGIIGGKRYHFNADIICGDALNDIALLKVEDVEDLKPLELEEKSVVHGEKVFAIGNSKGEGLCILEGIVSDAKRKLNGREVIMISAPVTNGNSGGPVFNSKGKLIGIVQSSHKDTSAMNYVIPVSTILDFLNTAKEKQNIDVFDKK